MKVFDGGSLQFGEFPYFLSDGNGGAVFAWYSSSPSLQCDGLNKRRDYFLSSTNLTTMRSMVSSAFLLGRLSLLVMMANAMCRPFCVVA